MDKKTGIKRIWQERFNDSGQWMDMVFSRIYRPEDAFVLESDNEIVSSLLLRPLEYMHLGRQLQTSYLYGAATLKRRQGHGFMSRLICSTLKASFSRGDAVMFLRPSRKWLYRFYSRFGFSADVLVDRQRYTAAHRFMSRPEMFSVETTVYDIDRLSADYTRLASLRPSTSLHSPADFKTILIDNSIDNGVKAVVTDADGETAAIAFALRSPMGHVHVTDLTASSEEAAEEALASIKSQLPDMMFIIDAYPLRAGIDLTPRAMARIIDAEAFLAVIAAADPSLKYKIKLSDPIIKENNALFTISAGKVSRMPLSESNSHVSLHTEAGPAGNTALLSVADSSGENVRKVDLDVSVETLTSILFSSPETGSIFNLPAARPYISLLLD